MHPCGVGVLRVAGEVARGPDPCVRRAQEVVDHDEPAVIDVDARGGQPDVCRAWRSSDGHQEAREGHLLPVLEVEHAGASGGGLHSGSS